MHSKNKKLHLLLLNNRSQIMHLAITGPKKTQRGHGCTLITLMIILINSCSLSPSPFIKNVLIKRKGNEYYSPKIKMRSKTYDFLFEHFYPFSCPHFSHSFLLNSTPTMPPRHVYQKGLPGTLW